MARIGNSRNDCNGLQEASGQRDNESRRKGQEPVGVPLCNQGKRRVGMLLAVRRRPARDIFPRPANKFDAPDHLSGERNKLHGIRRLPADTALPPGGLTPMGARIKISVRGECRALG